MINVTFTHPDTALDVVWALSLSAHTPLEEKRITVTADAADYLEPEVHFKGSYNETKLTTNPLAASEITTFNLFKRATQKGELFTVEGSQVPLVGQDYNAHRVGNLKPVSSRNGKHFTFTLTCRVTELL